jgi:hypothetical protein
MNPGMRDRVQRDVDQTVVPMVRQMPGFIGYVAILSEDGGALSLSIFQTEEQERDANQQMLSWFRENWSDVTTGPPQVLSGEVLAYAVNSANLG